MCLHQLYCYNLSYCCCCRLYSVLASTVLIQLVLFLLLQDVQCACINCIATTCLISVAAGCTVCLHQLYCYNLSYFCCCRLYSVLASTVLLQLVLLPVAAGCTVGLHQLYCYNLSYFCCCRMYSVLASTVLIQLVLFLLLQVVQWACINCIVDAHTVHQLNSTCSLFDAVVQCAAGLYS